MGAIWKYTFVYGAMNSYQCRFCEKLDSDKRNRRLKNGGALVDLEDALSQQIQTYMGSDYEEWLLEQGLEFGCLGNGKNVAAVFEVIG